MVCQNEHYITLMPFAPRSPFEMWILPKEHSSSYIKNGDASFVALAKIFSETMKRLDACISKCAL